MTLSYGTRQLQPTLTPPHDFCTCDIEASLLRIEE